MKIQYEGERGNETINHKPSQKQSIYVKKAMLREILAEAERQDRPISWLFGRAWTLSRKVIMNYPAV
jgi:uncharacterized small protein (TIGR04563 family)